MDEFDAGPFSVFSGTDVAQQSVGEVPTPFNDYESITQSMADSIRSADDPAFWMSQSAIERGGSPSGLVENSSSTQGQTSNFANTFMDAATKLLSQLRGNTGQDRNASTGRARPQRTVADLLGLTGGAGTVNPSAPGAQGMWILLVILGAAIVLMTMGRR